jgi:hypothetical protein
MIIIYLSLYLLRARGTAGDHLSHFAIHTLGGQSLWEANRNQVASLTNV